MKKAFFLICAFRFSFSICIAQSKAQQAIRHILKKQEMAWNAGDLRSFMQGYWQSDSMLFMGKKGLTYGYKSTLSHYLKAYPDTTYMGHFTSTILSVKKLSKKYFIVVGKWELQRSMGNVEGYFSLLFYKKNKHWLIVMDHTS